MAYPVHYVPAGDVLPIFFSTYDGGTGASLTMTGLAVTDIEIYKDGSTTQRSSDAGYTLLDTDGIDFDSLTGVHGFSIDTGDNTDSGFFTVGAWFHVVVSAVTVDAQTVSFVAAAFRLMPAESSAGVPKADVSHWLGTAAATPTVAGVPEVDVTHWIGTAVATPTTAGVPEVDITHIAGAAVSTTTAQIGVNAVQISGDATAADNLETAFDDTAGAVPWLGIVDQGTAQSASGVTLQLRAAAAFADDELIGAVIVITGGSTGVGQCRVITDYVASTDTATVDAWTTTPTGTITYKVFASPLPNNVLDLIKAVTDKLDDTLEDDAGTYRFTTNALEQAPTGGSAPTAAAIADAVWDEILSGHAVSGSTGEALSAAGGAGDPWITALPGSYSAGQAGKIIGDYLNASVSSRATQTSVDTIDGIVDAILVDTAEIGAAGAGLTALATAANLATVAGYLDTEIAAIKAKTDNLPAAPAATGDCITAAGVRTAVGLASANLDTQLDALPTNAELATALGTADDAVLTQIALVKAKTDSLTFTVAGVVDANIQRINDVTITGNGGTGTEFGV